MIFGKFNTSERNVFFTSDPHAYHKSIVLGTTRWVAPPYPYDGWPSEEERVKFCREHHVRNFADAESMTEAIVSNINSVVGSDDVLFILGDLCMSRKGGAAEFVKQLQCKNKYLIFGNHDEEVRANVGGVLGMFVKADEKAEIIVDDKHITLDHYRGCQWNRSHAGTWQLHGHAHGQLPVLDDVYTMDVGVDTNDLMPYSFADVKSIMDLRTANVLAKRDGKKSAVVES